jgi:hypothetical protein
VKNILSPADAIQYILLSRIVFHAKCCGEPFKNKCVHLQPPLALKIHPFVAGPIHAQHCVFSCLFQVTIVRGAIFARCTHFLSPPARSHFSKTAVILYDPFLAFVSGCAFVTYTSKQCAINAIKAMHHSQTMEVSNPQHKSNPLSLSLPAVVLYFLCCRRTF